MHNVVAPSPPSSAQAPAHGGQQQANVHVPHPNPTENDAQPWKPYECAWTETPVPLFRSLPSAYFRFRWMALWPFHRRLCRVPLLGYLSVGEALVLLAGTAGAAGWAAREWGEAGTGNVAIAFVILTYILAGRNNCATFLFGLSHERALFWHGLAAVAATGLALYHGLVVHLVDEHFELEEYMTRVITGWLSFGLIALLVITSAHRVLRHYFFKAWQWSHVVFLIATLATVAVHHPAVVLIGGGVWAADVLMRWAYMAGMRNPRQVELVALPAGVVRVSWPAKGFKYAGGQYVFLNIPSISWAEFHPFSLSSSPGSDVVHLHIRALGNWTERLHSLAMKDIFPGQPKNVRAYIQGPFGSPSIDLHGDRYKCFTLISGGIGVTPLQSFFNHLMSQRARGRPVRLAHLVWSVRDKFMVTHIKGFDETYASSLPLTLPTSFQPDLVSPNVVDQTRSHHSHAARSGAPSSNPSMSLAGAPTATAGQSGYVPPPINLQADATTAGIELQVLEEGGVGTAGRWPGPALGEEDDSPDKDFIATEFYLTQARDASVYDRGNIRPELQPAVRFGRPNMFAVLAEDAARAAAVGEERLAVLVCGPPGMMRDVQDAAVAISKTHRVAIDVHAEVFMF